MVFQFPSGALLRPSPRPSHCIARITLHRSRHYRSWQRLIVHAQRGLAPSSALYRFCLASPLPWLRQMRWPPLFAAAKTKKTNSLRCAWKLCPFSAHNRDVVSLAATSVELIDERLRHLFKAPADHDNVYCRKHRHDLRPVKDALGLPPDSPRTSSRTFSLASLSLVSSASPSASASLLSLPSASIDAAAAVSVRVPPHSPPSPSSSPSDSEPLLLSPHPSPLLLSPLAATAPFAVPVSRQPRRTQSLTSRAAPSLATLARRSGSVSLPPRPPLVVSPVSAVSDLALPWPALSSPALSPLVHVVNRRPCVASRRLWGSDLAASEADVAAAKAAALAEAQRKRALEDEVEAKAWRVGRDRFIDERAPWAFSTILQLICMTTCVRWDPYHRGLGKRNRPACQGLMVADGVKRVAAPAYLCGAHCSTCGRRVTLYNYAQCYVAIGYTYAEGEMHNVEVVVGDDNAVHPVEGEDAAAAAEELRQQQREEMMEQKYAADDDEEEKKDEVVVEERPPSAVPGGVGAEVRPGVAPRKRQRPMLKRHLRRDFDSALRNKCPARVVVPAWQPDGVKGFYNAVVLKEVAIYLLTGMRSKHLARLDAWSTSAQLVKQTTLFRYLALLKHYIKLIFDDDMLAQQAEMWRMVQQAEQRARDRGVVDEEALKKARRVLTASADGAWSNRGWSGKSFTHVVCNLTRIFAENGDLIPRIPLPIFYMWVFEFERHTSGHMSWRWVRVGGGTDAAAAPLAGLEVGSAVGLDGAGPSSGARKGPVEGEGGGAAYERRQVPVAPYSNNGNWPATKGSAGMEGEAMKQFNAHMIASGLMDGLLNLVTDGDLKVAKRMHKNVVDGVHHILDPGHTWKKIRKLIEGLCTSRKQFAGLPHRTYTWLRRCHHVARVATERERDDTKRADLMFDMMQCLLLQMIYHYHNLCDRSVCPHSSHRLVDDLIGKDHDFIKRVLEDWRPTQRANWGAGAASDVPDVGLSQSSDAPGVDLTQSSSASSPPLPLSLSAPSSSPVLDFSWPPPLTSQSVPSSSSSPLDDDDAFMSQASSSLITATQSSFSASQADELLDSLRDTADLSSHDVATSDAGPMPAKRTRRQTRAGDDVSGLGMFGFDYALAEATVLSLSLAEAEEAARAGEKKKGNRAVETTDSEVDTGNTASDGDVGVDATRDGTGSIRGRQRDRGRGGGGGRGRGRGGRGQGTGTGSDGLARDDRAPVQPVPAVKPKRKSVTAMKPPPAVRKAKKASTKKKARSNSDGDADEDDSGGGDSEYEPEAGQGGARTSGSDDGGSDSGGDSGGGGGGQRGNGANVQALRKLLAGVSPNSREGRCSTAVQRILRQRYEACRVAEATGQPRPYGTASTPRSVAQAQAWRMWIPMGAKGADWSHQFTTLVCSMMFDKTMSEICHGFGTTHNESFNSRRARATPKDTVMHQHFETRAHVCVLNNNHGLTWPKQLFEMMGLEWSGRDQARVDKSELHSQLRAAENERKRRQRAKAKRHTQVSALIKKASGEKPAPSVVLPVAVAPRIWKCASLLSVPASADTMPCSFINQETQAHCFRCNAQRPAELAAAQTPVVVVVAEEPPAKYKSKREKKRMLEARPMAYTEEEHDKENEEPGEAAVRVGEKRGAQQPSKRGKGRKFGVDISNVTG